MSRDNMLSMSNEHSDHHFTQATTPRPRTQTELRRRNRTLSYSDAFIVVAWLNATKGSAAYRRVLAVRQELEELGAMMDSLRQQRRETRARNKGRRNLLSQGDVSEAVQRAESRTRFRERHNALNGLLSGYAFVPAMAYDLDAGIWRCSSIPTATRGRTIEIPDGELTVQINEAAVIAALARLAANRELYKARLCQQCQDRWRVSERQIDRFCSTACRARFRMSQPESRERHARQQREYRQTLRSHPPRNEKKPEHGRKCS